jgi:hypothetical protein
MILKPRFAERKEIDRKMAMLVNKPRLVYSSHPRTYMVYMECVQRWVHMHGYIITNGGRVSTFEYLPTSVGFRILKKLDILNFRHSFGAWS